jgi:hypothetical protein
MGGKVGSAPTCYTAALWVRIQASPKNKQQQKYKMGDISKGVANTI